MFDLICRTTHHFQPKLSLKGITSDSWQQQQSILTCLFCGHVCTQCLSNRNNEFNTFHTTVKFTHATASFSGPLKLFLEPKKSASSLPLRIRKMYLQFVGSWAMTIYGSAKLLKQTHITYTQVHANNLSFLSFTH